MRKISVIILSVILFGVVTGCGGNTYTISVPGASQINKIELMENGRTVSLSDDMSINIIANALKNADTQTNNESIQDFPVNAEDIVSINMTLEDNSIFSVFIYERRDRYYMEQPYNGIYNMKERDYEAIEEFVD